MNQTTVTMNGLSEFDGTPVTRIEPKLGVDVVGARLLQFGCNGVSIGWMVDTDKAESIIEQLIVDLRRLGDQVRFGK